MPLSKQNLKPSKNPIGPTSLRPQPVTFTKPVTKVSSPKGGAKRP